MYPVWSGTIGVLRVSGAVRDDRGSTCIRQASRARGVLMDREQRSAAGNGKTSGPGASCAISIRQR